MFQLTTPTEVKLCSMTPRTEKHGDDDVSAVSLGLRIVAPNTLLDIVQPGLRDALYKAVEGQEQLPGVEPTTPLLRARGIEAVKLAACFEGWTLAIDRGIDESDPIKLGGSKIDKFVVEPKEGGSIELTFRVGSSDIDEGEAGWLFGHLGQQIVVTIAAPEVKREAIDGTVGHPGAAGGDERQGDLLTPEDALAGTVGSSAPEGDDDPADDDGSGHPDTGADEQAELEAGMSAALDAAGVKPKRGAARKPAGVH